MSIELSKEQVQEILYTIEYMIDDNTSPETIVNYVCSYLDFPSSGDINYSLIPCVSTELYSNIKVKVSDIEYVYRPRTYTYVKRCFPVFKESCCGGANIDKESKGCAAANKKNCENQADIILNVVMDIVYQHFERIITEYICNLVIKLKDYIEDLSHQGEHFLEILWADIKKKFGAAIENIAKKYKEIKDFINSKRNVKLVVKESKTDSGDTTLGHLKKAVQDAYTTIEGFITDMIKDKGGEIEQDGDLEKDKADMAYDLKEIGKKLKSMWKEYSDMMREVMEKLNDLAAQISNIMDLLESQLVLQLEIGVYTEEEDKERKEYSMGFEVPLNNKRLLNFDKFRDKQQQFFGGNYINTLQGLVRE